jgi:threonine synthase
MNPKGEILKKPDLKKMKEDMFAVSVDDEITRQTIKRIYERHNVLLEPHGAVGWEGLRKYINQNPDSAEKTQACACLETAHPAKFPEEIQHVLGIDPELPPSLTMLDRKEEQFDKIGSDYPGFKKYLINKYQ